MATRPKIRTVIAPDGSPLTQHDLPSPQTRRWVVSRKAIVVKAVHEGLLTIEQACARYSLSIPEYLAWEQAIEKHGLAGLRTTRIQQYRE